MDIKERSFLARNRRPISLRVLEVFGERAGRADRMLFSFWSLLIERYG